MNKPMVRKMAQRKVSLAQKSCQNCGETGKLQRHHPNYNEPLMVEILCQKCHVAADQRDGHRRKVAERKCLICKQTFQPTRTRRGVICGTRCLEEMGRIGANRRWAVRTTQKKCQFCQAMFTFKRARETTCSRSCGNKLAWVSRGGALNRILAGSPKV